MEEEYEDVDVSHTERSRSFWKKGQDFKEMLKYMEESINGYPLQKRAKKRNQREIPSRHILPKMSSGMYMIPTDQTETGFF
ncbi:MAG: hypothetical protein ACLU80_17245 [Dorea sp.]